MKKKSRNILIILSLIALTFVGIVGYGVYSIYTIFSNIGNHLNRPIPKEIEQAKVLKGKDFFNKSVIFKLDETSLLKTITESAAEKDEKKRQIKIDSQSAKMVYGFDDIKTCGEEIIAVGKFGGYVFDKKGELKREIVFEPSERKVNIFFYEHKTYESTLGDIKIVDFENDGKCEFISHGSISGMTAFNSDGNVFWRYGKRDFDIWENKTKEQEDKEVYVTGVDVGDLDNDGISEIIISQKEDGIRAFTINKKEIWFQPDDFPTADFKFIDIDADGTNELLEFQGESSQLRDAKTGKVTKKIKIDGSTDGILQSKNKDGKNIVQTFKIYENEFILADLENKVLLKVEAPLSEIIIKDTNEKPKLPSSEPVRIGNSNVAIAPGESFGNGFSGDERAGVYEPRAVWVKLKKDEPKYLAIVGAFISFPRANLYVYTNDGKLVYHELLAEDAETIAVLPKDNELEEILIGGKDTIWKFGAK